MKKNNVMFSCLLLFFMFFIGVNGVKAEKFQVQFRCGDDNPITGKPISNECEFSIIDKKMTSFTNSCIISNSADMSSGTPIKVDTGKDGYRKVTVSGGKAKCYKMTYDCNAEMDSKTKKKVYKLTNVKLKATSDTHNDAANGIICPMVYEKCDKLTKDNYQTQCPGLKDRTLTEVKTLCENWGEIKFEKACNSTSMDKKDVDREVQKAIEQAKKEKQNSKNPGLNLDEKSISCSSLLGSFASVLKNIILAICVVGVVILIMTMTGDFVKAITSGEADAMAEAFNKSIKRIIATIILLILPALVSFVIDVVNKNTIVIYTKTLDANGNVVETKSKVKIGNVSDCNVSD